MKNNNELFTKFMIIWCGELISSIGSGLTGFSLAVYVYQNTHLATNVALVTLCAFLPSILLSPFSGVLADRFDRRLMMMIGDSFSTVGLMFILFIMMNGTASLLQICIGVFISSVFASLLEPAYKATITDLLNKEQFAKASGLVQLAASSKYLVSPLIAGFLLTVTNIKTILVIDIFTFFIAVLATIFVRRGLSSKLEESKNQGFIKELKEGWNAVYTRKGVAWIVIILSFVTFFIGFIQTLLAPMVLSFSDAKTLGTITTISATGMVFGSLFIGIFSVKKEYVKLLLIGLAFTGIFLTMLGVSTNIFFIGTVGFLFFASLPFVQTSADVLIRCNIPNEIQGRAWAIIGFISQLGNVFAYAVSGVLADFVFEPLLTKNGLLSTTLGKLLGVGDGRGIGLLLMLSGICIIVIAIITSKVKEVKCLDICK